ncbi:MAG: hypothetical protein U9R50_02230 [Campylobacterota bacterium]|nr:hypothetical protein [Campylobacterota bacterium]
MCHNKLEILRIKSAKLYLHYSSGSLSKEEYLQQLKPLDYAIDKLEVESLSRYLRGRFAFEKSSSKLLH